MQVRTTPPAPEPIALRLKDAARAVGVSDRHLSDYIRDGSLPSVRLGGALLILKADLVDFLKARRTPAMPPVGVTRG